MEPTEFIRQWNEYLTRTGKAMPLVKLDASADIDASVETIRFLTEVGLPQARSLPFEFDFTENVKRVSDMFGCYGTPGDWEPDVYQRLHQYTYLGFDGGGNPICLDNKEQDKVVFLDHEQFTSPDLRGRFINSSVSQLAVCILFYQEMLEAYWDECGEDAELYYDNVPKMLVEQTINKMKSVDPLVSDTEGYWADIFYYI
jgi:hypothetical protein